MEKNLFAVSVSAVLITVLCVGAIAYKIKCKRKRRRHRRSPEYYENKRNAVNRFYESETTKSIVDFIKQYPLPYEMKFYNSHIEIFYHGGTATYCFLTNGIRKLHLVYLDKKPKYRRKRFECYTYEHELLAYAINEHFDDCYVFYPPVRNEYINIDYSRLTRRLKEF